MSTAMRLENTSRQDVLSGAARVGGCALADDFGGEAA